MSRLLRNIYPLAVRFGQHGEVPPLYVSYLSHTHRNTIVLGGGASANAEEYISFSGDGPLWDNEDLFVKLSELNARGLPFSYEPKEMESPRDLMGWWQDTGKLKESFDEISWLSSMQWHITTYKPLNIGAGDSYSTRPFGS